MVGLTEIIIAVISSGTITGLITALVARPRTSAEAESVVAANETVRLTTYQNIIADLDARIAATMANMRELENEIMQLRSDNRALREENEQLKVQLRRLRSGQPEEL